MRKNEIFNRLAIIVALLALGQTVHAANTKTFEIAVDTTPLVGHPAGPFSILVAFTDGSGLADGNNTVNIGSIDFNGGSGQANPTVFGGAGGSLESGVSLTDVSPLSLFSERFSPGSTLRFTVSVTIADDDGGVPDRLTFYILDSTGVPIPTLSPGADYLFGVALGSAPPLPDTFGTDTSRSPTSGSPIAISAPTVTSDLLPPVTTLVTSPSPNAAGWNNTNITVTLNSTDNEPGGTGVEQIQWVLTGAQTGSSTVPGSTATLTISAEGMTILTYFGTDNAGNIETAKSITVKIDRTPPVIIASGNPPVLWPPNGKMVNVMVSGTMADSLSGVDPRTPSFVVTDAYGIVQPSGPVSVAPNGAYSFTVSLEARRDGQSTNGRLYTIVVSAQDNAGNVSSSTTTVIVPHDQGN